MRTRMRQVQQVKSNLPPEHVELTIIQPQAVKLLYGQEVVTRSGPLGEGL